MKDMFSKQNAVLRPCDTYGWYALDLHRNNAATINPCAICGTRTDPECRPELFLYGTEALVCYECGRKSGPSLVDTLFAYREVLCWPNLSIGGCWPDLTLNKRNAIFHFEVAIYARAAGSRHDRVGYADSR
jgi:hypothetical protein